MRQLVTSGGYFSLSVPKGMTFSADYSRALSCRERPNSRVETTDTACIYRCDDGFTVNKYAVETANAVCRWWCGALSGDAGLAYFSVDGKTYFIKCFSYVWETGLPDNICVPLPTGG